MKVKLWGVSGSWNTTNISQGVNIVSLKDIYKFIETVSRMTDCVNHKSIINLLNFIEVMFVFCYA